MNTLYTISFIALIIASIWTGQTDPTDNLVISYKKKDMEKYKFYNEDLSHKKNLVTRFSIALFANLLSKIRLDIVGPVKSNLL